MKEVQLSGQKKDNVNTGGKTVGTSVVQIGTNGRKLGWGVQVVASGGNANSVWVGVRQNLSAGTNDDTDGVELAAGSGLFVPAGAENEVYAISDAAGQKITFLSY